ncbi:MAG: bifunctional nuclease family protein [Gemmatimonadetes bacterium]|nr:bifunctional nuclease family protein [Gemmatimonadota bacterium]MYF15987.1 bifunctional nuclease family protein [Gemmatimonadota bacterium]
MTEMEVIAVQLEPNSNHPLVWLKDKDQKVFLPIAIGNFEAVAISLVLHDEPPPRPIAYDLLCAIMDGFDVRVEQVLVSALKDETFFAEITLVRDGESIVIDSRPSDALALALRVDAPVFVADQVIEEAGLSVKQDVPIEDGEDNIAAIVASVAEDEPAEEAPQVTQQVDALKARLQEAVELEEYEEAARLRDEIGRLEHSIEK